jgi:hypothetical protein
MTTTSEQVVRAEAPQSPAYTTAPSLTMAQTTLTATPHQRMATSSPNAESKSQIDEISPLSAALNVTKFSNKPPPSSQFLTNTNTLIEVQNEEHVKNQCILIIQSFIRQYLVKLQYNELYKTKQFLASLYSHKATPLTHVQRVKHTGRRPPSRGHRTPGALSTPSTEYNGPIIFKDPDDPEGTLITSDVSSPMQARKSRPVSGLGLVVFDAKDVKLRSVPVEPQATKKVEEDLKPEFTQVKLRKSLPHNMSTLVQSKFQEQTPTSQDEIPSSPTAQSSVISPTPPRNSTAATVSPGPFKHKKGPLDHIKQKGRSHSTGPILSLQVNESSATSPSASHSSPNSPLPSPFVEKKRSQLPNKETTAAKDHPQPTPLSDAVPIPPPLVLNEPSNVVAPIVNDVPLPPPLVLDEIELPPPLSPIIGEHEKMSEKKKNKIIQFLQKFFRHRVKRETLVQRGVIVETNAEYNETNTNVPSKVSQSVNVPEESVCFSCKVEFKKKEDKEKHICSECLHSYCSKCMKKKSKKGKLCKACAAQKE